MNLFKFYPEEYKGLKEIDRNSKKFKRKVSFVQARLGKYILQDFFRNKDSETAVKMGRKYLFYLVMAGAYLLATIAIGVIAYVLFGNDITQEEESPFFGLAMTMALSVCTMLIFVLKSGKVRSEYLIHLFDTMPVKEYSFNEEVLSDVVYAFRYSHQYYLSENDKCVCYYCKVKFKADKVLNVEGVLHCPVCKFNTILTESSGCSLEDEFVDAMHEYWIEE